LIAFQIASVKADLERLFIQDRLEALGVSRQQVGSLPLLD